MKNIAKNMVKNIAAFFGQYSEYMINWNPVI